MPTTTLATTVAAPASTAAVAAAPPGGHASIALAEPYRTEFAVNMTCESCVASVRKALAGLGAGVQASGVSLETQTVVVDSTLPPSALLAALRSTGIKTVVRGHARASGAVAGAGGQVVGAEAAAATATADPLPAAVCLFESFPGSAERRGWAQTINGGLARLVGLAAEHTLVDATLSLPVSLVVGSGAPTYDDVDDGSGGSAEEHALRAQDVDTASLPVWATASSWRIQLHEYGDISQGVASTGACLRTLGEIDGIALDRRTGRIEGSALVDCTDLPLWSVLGRALVLVPVGVPGVEENVGVCGVVARSAGAFENAKRVCTCSGQTIWQEDAL
ncbi:copper chaperone [Polyrhizophydium stewartii]|uniref:Superoxide dismutase 1 copper chaperone n=1 Tax=Polyrhizophydium stewartii TaxID=2732419 RepID=A0ABR4N8B1_9FUNG